MSWFLSLFYPADPVLAKTDIVIEDGGLFLEEQAKEVLLYRADTRMLLPVRRSLGGFSVYTEEKIAEDSERLLDWLLEHGYKDAIVTPEISLFQGDFGVKLPRGIEGIQVTYHVFRGMDWNIQEINIEGIDASPFLRPIGTVPWAQSISVNLIEDIQSSLAEQGFLYPKISESSTMVTSNGIALTISVEQGEIYHFSKIKLVSSADHQPLQIAGISEAQWEGELFNLQKVKKLLFQLKELKSVEKVTYDLIRNDETFGVDVVFEVEFKDNWSREPVVSISSEATTYAADLGLRWENHSQIFQVPLSFEGLHQVGFRAFPRIMQQDFGYYGLSTIQAMEGRMAFSPSSGLSLIAGGLGGIDTQIGYQITEERFYSGTRWQISAQDYMVLQYSWNQLAYDPMFNHQEIYEQWFGALGSTNAALDAQVRQEQWEWNWNHFIAQRQLLQLKTIPLGWSNDSRFSRFSFNLEQRILQERWMWRLRIQAGSTVWYDEPASALNNRFFLGGFQSLRGWSYRRVRVPNSTADNFDLMVGGDKMFFASVEGRFQVLPLYQIVYFFDVGRIWEHWSSPMAFNDLLPSIGVGLMIPTLAGDVIFLPTYQLNPDPQLEKPPSRWGFHVAFAPKMRPL